MRDEGSYRAAASSQVAIRVNGCAQALSAGLDERVETVLRRAALICAWDVKTLAIGTARGSLVHCAELTLRNAGLSKGTVLYIAPRCLAGAKRPPADQLIHAFRVFDNSGTGRIANAEFVEILTRGGINCCPMSREQAEEFVSKCDADGDAHISLVEFAALWGVEIPKDLAENPVRRHRTGFDPDFPYTGGPGGGRGRVVWKDGSIYEGDFVERRRHGNGIMHYTSGVVYTGQWVSDQREGEGTCSCETLGTYIGEWRADRRTGRGTWKYTDGTEYEGEFLDGRRHGHGTLHYPDGSTYEGEFRAGMKEGRGVFRYANGDVYEGDFHEDRREGYGTYRYSSFHSYEGQYKAGLEDGHGVYRYANGNVYAGQFRAGRKDGPGTYWYAEGDRAETLRYEAGAAIGEAAMWSADRQIAWRVVDGRRREEIPVAEAQAVAAGLGLSVPESISTWD